MTQTRRAAVNNSTATAAVDLDTQKILPIHHTDTFAYKRDVALAVLMIMGGCTLNVFSLEYITKNKFCPDPGCGIIVTFWQMVFIAIIGAIENFNPKTMWFNPRKIPVSAYFGLVVVFFVVSIVNNKALDFRISLPLHMVFRSGSLGVSLIVGVLYLRKSYSMKIVASVIMVSIGIYVVTMAEKASSTKVSNDTEEVSDLASKEFLIGIGMLVFALIATSFQGSLQEKTYTDLKVSKNEVPWQENLFYTHLLAVPLFLPLFPDLAYHANLWNECQPIVVSNELQFPRQWTYMLINAVTQYICIRGVYALVGLTTNVTMTLCITLRKMVSFFVSVWWFQHDFTSGHATGLFLVVIGTTIYIKETQKPPTIVEVKGSDKKNY